jgi:hypothetical protein
LYYYLYIIDFECGETGSYNARASSGPAGKVPLHEWKCSVGRMIYRGKLKHSCRNVRDYHIENPESNLLGCDTAARNLQS